MKLFIYILLFITSLKADDDATTLEIIDFTADVVANYFLTIFVFYTAIITPFFVAFSLITKR